MAVKWDKKINRYRAPNGRLVSQSAIAKQIDALALRTEKKMRDAAQRFNDKKINAAQFQIEMTELIKSSHIVASSVANGGKEQMTAKDWAEVGREVKTQYQFLRGFMRKIERGQMSPVQIVKRAELYSFPIESVYVNRRMVKQKEMGRTRVKRVTRSVEGCPSCALWARKGFVDIDEMPPLGSLKCKWRCRCKFVYQ